MRLHLREGLAAAEAARRAVEGVADVTAAAAQNGRPELEAGALQLRTALDGFDEAGAQAALDALFGTFTVETVLAAVILPYLVDLGERWSTGEATVAQEHFASNLIRGRLLGIGRGWDSGEGPRAVLACAPGEQHDLGLIAFGLTLNRRGWRITYLGPDTPVESLVDTAGRLEPDLVVVAATRSGGSHRSSSPSLLSAARRALPLPAREQRRALTGFRRSAKTRSRPRWASDRYWRTWRDSWCWRILRLTR